MGWRRKIMLFKPNSQLLSILFQPVRASQETVPSLLDKARKCSISSVFTQRICNGSNSQTERLCRCCCILGAFGKTACRCVDMTELCCAFVFPHRHWCFLTSYTRSFLRRSSPRLTSLSAFMEEPCSVSLHSSDKDAHSCWLQWMYYGDTQGITFTMLHRCWHTF